MTSSAPNDAAGELPQRIDQLLWYHGKSSPHLRDELVELFAAHQRRLLESLESELVADLNRVMRKAYLSGHEAGIARQGVNHLELRPHKESLEREVRTIIARKIKET